jgi:hypothetical protein
MHDLANTSEKKELRPLPGKMRKTMIIAGQRDVSTCRHYGYDSARNVSLSKRVFAAISV